jgi:hypothetical protein
MKRRIVLQGMSAALLAGSFLGAEEILAMGDGKEVFELRVYHAAEGKLPDLLARFREHTDALFARHGMKSVAYWVPVDEPVSKNTLIYILRHPSREEAAVNWKAFQDDPEWKSVKAKSEEKGSLVEKVDSTYMELTDFSKKV